MTAKGRKESQLYDLKFMEKIPVSQLAKSLANVMQEFTQSGGVRPFGVSLLLCGYDDSGPHLYQVDPSGTFWGWKASAIGQNVNSSKAFLEKRYREDIEIEDAVHTAILALKENFDGEMNQSNIEIGVVGEDRVFRILSENEVKDYLEEVL
ncbi:Proteasome subunit alpha type-2 [Bonamia ostreae]|uniref:Proteasome subunit alpha type-2 n=1 Tax=Bonamia ostreae TaxID=126728 RepID=A0ABV2AGU9_9EUKA